MKFAGIRWVFFDIGNTLIDENDAAWDRIIQIQQTLTDYGVEVTAGTVRAAIEDAAAGGADSPVSRAIATLSGSIELGERLKSQFAWRKDLEKPYPDAERVLSALSRRYSVGVIANQSAGTEYRLESWGLLQYMSLVIASAEVGLAKPELAIFEMAMELAASTAEQTVMIGDRIDNDITPAKLLGWKTIRVKQGLTLGQAPIDQSQEPEFEVRRLDEILGVLL